jgi:uncharacterized membrane protein
MWNVLGAILVVTLALAVGYLGHAIQIEATEIRLFAGSQLQISYPDLITIILTAFGVIIAVASIGLAGAAVIGWNSIEGKAMRTAAGVIKSDLNDNNGKLHKLIKEAISDRKSPFHQTLQAEMQKMIFSGVLSFDSPSQNEESDDEHSQ